MSELAERVEAAGDNDDLRNNAKALAEWFDSMTTQRKNWSYRHSVETDAYDALEAVYRVAHSVVALAKQTADAIDALRARKD